MPEIFRRRGKTGFIDPWVYVDKEREELKMNSRFLTGASGWILKTVIEDTKHIWGTGRG